MIERKKLILFTKNSVLGGLIIGVINYIYPLNLVYNLILILFLAKMFDFISYIKDNSWSIEVDFEYLKNW